MIELPEELRQNLQAIFAAVDLSAEEIKEKISEFEEDLTLKFFGLALQKLPEAERKAAVELANSEKGNEFKSKLEEWLNETEIGSMWEKVTRQQMTEMLQALHKDASDEQQERLKALVKPEAWQQVVD